MLSNVTTFLSIFLGSGIGIAGIKYFNSKIKEQEAKAEALRNGVQALLRNQMIRDYQHYKAKGYAPIYAKENFENMWQQYHSLGANGVMDGIHEEFKELPTE